MKKIITFLFITALMISSTFYAQKQKGKTLRDMPRFSQEAKEEFQALNAPELFFAIVDNDYTKTDDNLVDVNTTLSDGTTPLGYALWLKDEKMAQYLIEKGADPNIKSPGGNNALLSAIGNDFSKDFITFLIDKGVDTKVRNNVGITPLIMAVDNPEIVLLLLNKGLNINEPDKNENTPLFHAAILRNNAKVVSALINNGADVKITNNKGQTALFGVFDQTFGETQAPDAEAVKILVKAGTPINAVDNDGNTALHSAVTTLTLYGDDKRKLIQTLIDLGADLSIKNNAGKTPLDLAKTLRQFDDRDAVVAILEKAVEQETK